MLDSPCRRAAVAGLALPLLVLGCNINSVGLELDPGPPPPDCTPPACQCPAPDAANATAGAGCPVEHATSASPDAGLVLECRMVDGCLVWAPFSG